MSLMRKKPFLWLAAVVVLALAAWAGAIIVANAGVDIVLPR